MKYFFSPPIMLSSLSLTIAIATPAMSAPQFTDITPTAPTTSQLFHPSISRNGNFVVGTRWATHSWDITNVRYYNAFRYDIANNNLYVYGPSNEYFSFGYGISPDGLLICGTSSIRVIGDGGNGGPARVFTAGPSQGVLSNSIIGPVNPTEFTTSDLPTLLFNSAWNGDGWAIGGSSPSYVIVGGASNFSITHQAFSRSMTSTGFAIPPSQNGQICNDALSVSEDGNRIVGIGLGGSFGNQVRPFSWNTGQSHAVQLSLLPGYFEGWANSVSADGTTVVGWCGTALRSGGVREACIWPSNSTTPVALPTGIPNTSSAAFGVLNGGTLVVGQYAVFNSATGQYDTTQACMWKKQGNTWAMSNLNVVAPVRGVAIGSMHLLAATSIAENSTGYHVVGLGQINGQAAQNSWLLGQMNWTLGCQPADIASDAGQPLLPGLPNTGVNEGDYNYFFNGFFIGDPLCNIAYDSGEPLPPFGPAIVGAVNNGVNEGDYNCFFNFFFLGCD